MSPRKVRAPALLRTIAGWVAASRRVPDLLADLDEIFAREVERRGRGRATLWYLGQTVRGVAGWLTASPREWRMHLPSLYMVPTDAMRALRRVARARGLALPFMCIVGFGIAAVGFMAQVRRTVMTPDMGLGIRIWRVFWLDDRGRERSRFPVSGAEPWIPDPPGGISSIIPMRTATFPFRTPEGAFRASLETLPRDALASVGVHALLGRDPAAPGEVLLSYAFWSAHWKGSRDVLGSVLDVPEGEPAVVAVGVAPKAFSGLMCCVRPDGWMVQSPQGAGAPSFLFAVGVTARRAATAALTKAIARDVPTLRSTRLVRGGEATFGREAAIIGGLFGILMLLSTLALAGTIVNGVNLVVADAIDRRRELKLRSALGAASARLVLDMTLEIAWLAAGSALVAALVARVLMWMAPWALPIVGPDFVAPLALKGTGIAAIAAGAGVVTFLVGIPAAFAVVVSSRGPLVDRGVVRDRPAVGLLAAQIALAAALASMTFTYFGEIRAMQGDFVGFRNGHAAIFRLSSSGDADHSSPEALVSELGATPGVSSVALTRFLPAWGVPRDTVVLPDGRREEVLVDQSTDGFFNVLGLRILAGQVPRTSDEGALSADIAGRLFGRTADAIGETVEVGGEAVTIVGVAEAATWGSGSPRPSLYRGWSPPSVAGGVLLVRPTASRGSVPPSAVAPVLTAAGLALAPFGTLDGLMVRAHVLNSFLSRLAALFTAICLLVALSGIHTHFLRWVRRRERDLGIRLALGARRNRVGLGVLAAASRPLALGLLLGSGLAVVAHQASRALLGRSSVGLWMPLLAALLVTAALALVATAGPATRAARQSPLTLIRNDG